MKKRLIPILLVIMMLISVLPVHAVEAEPTFVVDSVTAEAGETVDVTISVKNNPGIASIKLSVAYDEALTLNSITYNAAIGGMSQQPQSKASPVTLNWFNGAADSYGDWVFATLSFTVDADAEVGSYAITVTYKADNVYNIAEENITFAIEDGEVEVVCGHKNTSNIPETPADCDESGFTAGVYCNDCQTYISGHEEIPATGEHSDADGKWNYDEDGHYCVCECGLMYAGAPHSGGSATCTTKAVCDTCHVEYGSVDTSSHGQTEARNASEATCNQEGYTGDTYCLDCGEMISAGSVIPATGEHTGGEATCMEKAVCEVCGTAYGELAVDNHGQTEIRGAVDATCGNAGFTGDVFCVDCGAVIEAGSMIGATGDHTDNNGDELCDDCGADMSCKHTGGEATCTQRAVCEICSTAYGELNAYNHGETEIKNAEEATCKNAGYTGDTYCADCGEKLSAGEEIPANNAHSYGDWVTTKEPTEEEAGLKEKTCSVCGDMVSEELAKLEKEPEENPGTGDAEYMVAVLVMAFAVFAAMVLLNKKKYMV